ncbi:hypothetical protein BN381_90062 [Candidatus Microthrix parvicella RN1]|uniref:Uncharacterized protein n=1 Tax=Candidatus Neomicrothrix parvicella RN1 TaxID=1229780 RepID=R4Z783_9ACTN|nr:hypothetical protein BN381_90062 [Candidatus Microthrix parvicella RN1]
MLRTNDTNSPTSQSQNPPIAGRPLTVAHKGFSGYTSFKIGYKPGISRHCKASSRFLEHED